MRAFSTNNFISFDKIWEKLSFCVSIEYSSFAISSWCSIWQSKTHSLHKFLSHLLQCLLAIFSGWFTQNNKQGISELVEETNNDKDNQENMGKK